MLLGAWIFAKRQHKRDKQWFLGKNYKLKSYWKKWVENGGFWEMLRTIKLVYLTTIYTLSKIQTDDIHNQFV